MSIRSILGLIASVIGLTALATAADKPAAESGGRPAASEKPVQFPNAGTACLERLIGHWSVTEHHYNLRGELVATVKGTEDVAWILDHHAVTRTYTTGADAPFFRAVGTLCWNDAEKKYRGVWFDNATTSGPTMVTGEWDEPTNTMASTLDLAAKDGSKLRYKVIEKFVDEERREAATYLVQDGAVVKQLEVQYKRTVPCPSSVIRPVIGG